MRKLVGFLVLAILLITPQLSLSQPARVPRYSLAYSRGDNEVQVVTLVGENEWVQQPLPARLMFGQADVALTMPQWSADGRTLYAAAYEPQSETIATRIYAYEVFTGQFREVVTVADPAQLSPPIEYVRIDSISPDGRFAWTTRLISYQTQLINLSEREVVTTSTCPARVLTWLPAEVVIACTGALFAAPDIYSLNLATGEPVRYLEPPVAETGANYLSAYVTGGMLLGDESLYMVGPYQSAQETEIGILQWNDYNGQYLGKGKYLSVSENQQYAAFFVGDRLMRMNLATGILADMGTVVVTAQPLWAGDTLQFWYTREVQGNFEILRVEAAAKSRREYIVYSGAAPTNWQFSPTGAYVALQFQASPSESYVEIHGREGLLWVSDFAYPDSFVQLPTEWQLAWSADKKWLHLRYAPIPTELPTTLSLNLENQTTILAPETYGTFVGESPDGAWWLYEIGVDPLQARVQRLIVYQRATSQLEVLSDGIPLYSNPQYPAWNYYVWSPEVR